MSTWAPPEAQAWTPAEAVGKTPPSPTNWDSLFSGIDGVEDRMTYTQQQNFKMLAKVTDNTKETRAHAINRSYLGSRLPMMAPEAIDGNWQAVKDSYASTVLGLKQENVTDTQLYDEIGKYNEARTIHLKEEFAKASPYQRMVMLGRNFSTYAGENAKEVWDAANKPFVPLPTAKMPDTGAGMTVLQSPAVAAGVWNAFKPFIEGIETPLGVATLGVAGVLGPVARSGDKFARGVLGSMSGIFTGLMAKHTAESAGRVPEVFNDPNATVTEKVEAVATPVLAGATALLGAHATIYEIKGPQASQRLSQELNGKSPSEAATILRNEQAKTTEPVEAVAYEIAARQLDAITEAGIKQAEQAMQTMEGEGGGQVQGRKPRIRVRPQGRPATPEEIESAAIQTPGGVMLGPDHKTIRQQTGAVGEEGFVTKSGEFKTREEAAKIAEEAGQLKPGEVAPEQLHSHQVEMAKPRQLEEPLIGMTNAVVDAERAKMGLPPATHAEQLTFKKAFLDADKLLSEDPLAGQKLVQDVMQKPRALDGVEDALMLRELARLKQERANAAKQLEEATAKGDDVGIFEAAQRADAASEAYFNAQEASTLSGTKNAQGLAMRQMLLKEDFSLAGMESRLRQAKTGKRLTPEEKTMVEEMAKRLEAAEKKLEAYTKERKPVSKTAKTLSDYAVEARARITQRMREGRLYSGINPEDLFDYSVVGADLLARGVKDLAKWSEAMVKEFGEKLRPHLQNIWDEARKLQKDTKRLEAFKTRLETRTERLKQKIATKNIEPEPKPTPLHLDEQAMRLQAEYDLLKLDFQKLVERTRYEQSTALSKTAQQALSVYDAARLLMTTGEFSFILRQGKMAALSRPIQTLKAIPDTFKAFMADEAGARAVDLQTLNHPDMPAAKRAKLHVIDEGQKISRQEEILVGKVLAEKIPVVGKAVQRFDRAAAVFLNRVRFDMWQAMRKPGMTAAEEAQIARFVNQATGRGQLGSLEAAAVPLGRLLFSPRYLASRIQLAAGESLWGGTAQTRAIIGKEYARALIGLGAYYTMLYTAFSLGEDVTINADPRSSDFGKVKIGNTRLDPLAGLSQVIVFASRTATGEKVTSKGNVKPIRGKVPFGGEKWTDVAVTFGRSKLHPVPGAIANLFDGTNLAGEEATIASEAAGLSGPVTYQDVYEALLEQGLPEGVALGLLAMLGEGLQTYDTKKKPGKQFLPAREIQQTNR